MSSVAIDDRADRDTNRRVEYAIILTLVATLAVMAYSFSVAT
jgi:Flp pilus assembly pilin Flp